MVDFKKMLMNQQKAKEQLTKTQLTKPEEVPTPEVPEIPKQEVYTPPAPVETTEYLRTESEILNSDLKNAEKVVLMYILKYRPKEGKEIAAATGIHPGTVSRCTPKVEAYLPVKVQRGKGYMYFDFLAIDKKSNDKISNEIGDGDYER